MRSSALLLVAWLTMPSAFAAQISVQILDAPGEGFNDASAFTPEGGNNATTLGEARRNVMRAAAEQWGAVVESEVEIVLQASFEPVADGECTRNQGPLAAAGPLNFVAGFPGAPRADVFYPVALANALAGQDLDPGRADIGANFNGAVDTDPNCLSGLRFYYGFDHAGGRGTVDFFTTAMHEIAHGLGVTTFIQEDGSNIASPDFLVQDTLVFDNSQGRFWTEMTQVQRANSVTNNRNVVLAGNAARAGALSQGLSSGNGADADSRPLIYVPAPFEPGSSIAHWDTEATPSLLMEPFATNDVRSNRGVDMTSCLMQDMGWRLQGGVGCPDSRAADTPPEISAIADQDVEAGSTGEPVPFMVTDNSRITPDDNLTLRAQSDNEAVIASGDVRFGGSGNQRTLQVLAGTQTGNARITVIVDDGIFTARERFLVSVRAPDGNRPPVARDDSVAVLSTDTATGNVLADNGAGPDSDPDGDTLTVVAVAGSAEDVGREVRSSNDSRLRIDASGAFTYTPGGELAALQPSRTASESFSYTVGDGRGGSDTAQVTFFVTGDPGTDQHGDTRATATIIAIEDGPVALDAAINVAGDRDYFAFTLTRAAEVRLASSGDTDTVGTLMRSDGTVIARNDDTVDGERVDPNFRIVEMLDAGDYFLEVSGFENSATGNYQLRLEAIPVTVTPEQAPETMEPSADSTPQAAEPPAEGGSGGGQWLFGMLSPLLLASVLGVRRRYTLQREQRH